MTRIAVITIARGRHEHLLLQQEALAASALQPDQRIVVAMGDPGIAALLGDGARIIHLPVDGPRLPLAAARNAGAEAALAGGADVLIFLDVDCLPGPALVGAYADAASDPSTERMLLCGPVAYLPPPPGGGYDLATVADLAEPHAGRPAPAPGTVLTGGDHSLFWSLSFAVTREVWATVGGFCERYAGYGAEDTDFGWTARARGVELAWVGGARAYHQFHPISDPPVEHVADIVRNGAIFAERWGDWPMTGWLEAFEELGLVTRSSDGGYALVA